MAKYDIVEPDEWIRPVMEGYKMVCCDCGLVHKIDFKIEEGRVWIKATRDKRTTVRLSQAFVQYAISTRKPYVNIGIRHILRLKHEIINHYLRL